LSKFSSASPNGSSFSPSPFFSVTSPTFTSPPSGTLFFYPVCHSYFSCFLSHSVSSLLVHPITHPEAGWGGAVSFSRVFPVRFGRFFFFSFFFFFPIRCFEKVGLVILSFLFRQTPSRLLFFSFPPHPLTCPVGDLRTFSMYPPPPPVESVVPRWRFLGRFFCRILSNSRSSQSLLQGTVIACLALSPSILSILVLLPGLSQGDRKDPSLCPLFSNLSARVLHLLSARRPSPPGRVSSSWTLRHRSPTRFVFLFVCVPNSGSVGFRTFRHVVPCLLLCLWSPKLTPCLPF